MRIWTKGLDTIIGTECYFPPTFYEAEIPGDVLKKWVSSDQEQASNISDYIIFDPLGDLFSAFEKIVGDFVFPDVTQAILRQIYTELTRNAYGSMGEQASREEGYTGRIRIGLHVENGTLSFLVSDNGVGFGNMPAHERGDCERRGTCNQGSDGMGLVTMNDILTQVVPSFEGVEKIKRWGNGAIAYLELALAPLLAYEGSFRELYYGATQRVS